MQSSKLGYFIKLVFVFLLVVAGFISLLKETVFVTHKAEVKERQTVLSEASVSSIVPLDNLKSEITPVAINSTNDYMVRVPILMYHHVRSCIPITQTLNFGLSVTPEQLDQQLSYIRQNGYQTISLNDLADALENKTPLPPRSLILTFDDGYRDFYTSAFPLLKKYNLRAVSFYIVGYSNYPDYMNWDMVREIHDSGLVDVESHTMDHPMLTKLTPDQERAEIFDSKRILEEQLNKKVNYFDYPYGDLNDQVVSLVAQAGYKLAVGVKVGSDLHSSKILDLKRVPINGFDSFDVFKSKLDK